MKQTERKRKTRKEKERSEIRKIEREIEKLSLLNDELMKKHNKNYKTEDKLLHAEAILKSTALVSFVVSVASIFTLGIRCIAYENEIATKIDKKVVEYMDSQEYEEIKAGYIHKYYDDYTNGEISTKEFENKVKELNSSEFIEDSFLQKDIKEIQEECSKSKNKFVDRVWPAIYGSLALGGSTLVAGDVVQKKRSKSYRESDKIYNQIKKNQLRIEEMDQSFEK